MAAGLGFKTFSTGDVLSAVDVNGYLMQGVWVFADAAARTSAVASPQEGNMSYLKDTNDLQYYSGSTWVSVDTTGTSPTYLIVRDEKANNTQGGGFTSSAWRTRDLQTTPVNTISGASVGSNQITLPAGTYSILASAPAFKVASHVTRLYNITDSAETIIGTIEQSAAADTITTRSFINGNFTIAGTKTFEIQHYSSATQATNGFGSAGGLGVVEVYTSVYIEKVS
jgi:hypothetical protein